MTPQGNSREASSLLGLAQQGSLSSLGKLMSLYSGYLRALVAQRIDGRLQARVSPSDVLQETFAEVHRDFEGFRGKTPEEFRAWMRQILLNNLFTAIERHVQAAKRTIQREVSIEPSTPNAARPTGTATREPAGREESPSAAMWRGENRARLEAALERLPEDYRLVIRWRHLEDIPFTEIAQRMSRSEGAVRMLWLRAIKRLQKDLRTRSGS